MSSGDRGGGRKDFPPANSSYRDVSTSMVIQTDRSEIIRRDREAGSDMVESLWGRASMSEMGSRAGRETAPKTSSNVMGLRSSKIAKQNQLYSYDLDDEMELKYRPRTKETRTAYEYMLTFLQQLADFSDQPASVLRSATEEVLIILKATDDSWKDFDRKLKIEQCLGIKSGEMSSEKYSQLVNLARRITDFSIEKDDNSAEFDGSQDIAVVFDDGEGEGQEEDEDFGEVSNLIKDDEEEGAEDEAEYEKTLPAIARMKQRTVIKPEEKILDLESLAFPQGNL
jgi:pre-mRNA-splicing helicase BRR2